MSSPYENVEIAKWIDKTEELIKDHPLTEKEIVEVVLESWEQIFSSKIGDFQIGKEIFPSPQIISFLMHELIPRNLEKKKGNDYKVGESKGEKDIVYEPEDKYSIEIKGSSNSNHVFANRSYAQPQTGNEKKGKDGYFITVNFEKFSKENPNPKILKIRFGYLEHSDWNAQVAASGQQASLSRVAYAGKLKLLYDANEKEDKQQKLFDQALTITDQKSV